MENNNMSLPPFVTQIWMKMKTQTIQEFRNSAKENLKELTQKGYDVEIEWLNSKGEICENERDIDVSVVCRIVERNQKSKDINNDWVTEQRSIEERRCNKKEER